MLNNIQTIRWFCSDDKQGHSQACCCINETDLQQNQIMHKNVYIFDLVFNIFLCYE